MLISGHEHGPLGFCKGEEVVVAGIGRARTHVFWIRGEYRGLPENADEFGGPCRADSLLDLRIRKGAVELGEQQLGHYELMLAREPAGGDLGRRPASGEQSGDEDVRVENCSQSATTSRFVLGFNGKRRCLVLGHVAALPKPFEQVESEFAP